MDYHLLMSYRFEVTLGGNAGNFGFSRVDGLKISAAFEPLEVGGYNNAPVMLRVPVKDSGRLTLERGKYFSGSAQAVKLTAGQALPEPVTVDIKDDSGKTRASYSISKPMLESVEISGLNATDSAVLIEKLTIAHQGITEA